MENENLEETTNEIIYNEEVENNMLGKYVVITSKFNCQSFPLNDKAIFVSQEDLDQIGITKCFDLESNCVVDYDNTEDLKKQKLDELRAKRVPLLKAFDIYKSSVAYGVEFENEEQREEIVKWYGDLLHLEESAFNVIPERIRYYL